MGKFIDKTNNRYGKLLVVSRHPLNDNRNKPMWLCKCDCGRELLIRSQQLNDSPRGQKYCGNCSLNSFIQGKQYLSVLTTKGESILCDLDSFNLIKQYTWHIDKKGYAVTYVNKTCVKMHRYLTNPPTHLVVDHKNGNTLDNRSCNLRVCTPSQNSQNSKNLPKHDNLPRGVYQYPSGTYYARVNNIYLGSTSSLQEAIHLRKQGELKYQGEYCYEQRTK